MTFEEAFRRGFALSIHCDTCRRDVEVKIPATARDLASPLAPYMQSSIEEVFRRPGFRCRECGYPAKRLLVGRLLKSGRRWSVELTVTRQ